MGGVFSIFKYFDDLIEYTQIHAYCRYRVIKAYRFDNGLLSNIIRDHNAADAVILPEYLRCCSHTLNIVATKHTGWAKLSDTTLHFWL